MEGLFRARIGEFRSTRRSRGSARASVFPYTALFRSRRINVKGISVDPVAHAALVAVQKISGYNFIIVAANLLDGDQRRDRKSTRLNSSHGYISYAVFCLKQKKRQT